MAVFAEEIDESETEPSETVAVCLCRSLDAVTKDLFLLIGRVSVRGVVQKRYSIIIYNYDQLNGILLRRSCSICVQCSVVCIYRERRLS